MTAATEGDARAARAWAEEARVLLADTIRAPRTRNMAVALLLLGYFYYLGREHERARLVGQTSRAIANELGATGGPTDGATTLLGWLALEEGDVMTARALFTEVLVGGALEGALVEGAPVAGGPGGQGVGGRPVSVGVRAHHLGQKQAIARQR